MRTALGRIWRKGVPIAVECVWGKLEGATVRSGIIEPGNESDFHDMGWPENISGKIYLNDI